jgi:hypothetical protein
MPFGAEVLENGETRFPLWAPAAELAGATYRNVLTGEKGAIDERDGVAVLPAGVLLRSFPVALLEAEG